MGFVEQCALDAYTQAAIEACDALDGLIDGVIADKNACTFNTESAIVQTFTRNDIERNL